MKKLLWPPNCKTTINQLKKTSKFPKDKRTSSLQNLMEMVRVPEQSRRAKGTMAYWLQEA
ncbi:hypothetical protein NQ318_009698 [Aromia moschata]|uniref:Uncharacterized protein n=1 Tax=Aromia moschata TaxID=1265417 RepID=A0AAV8XZJ7_9CUCU|nr:hypothetical protein NQ318_009698 [Aromia moschata]